MVCVNAPEHQGLQLLEKPQYFVNKVNKHIGQQFYHHVYIATENTMNTGLSKMKTEIQHVTVKVALSCRKTRLKETSSSNAKQQFGTSKHVTFILSSPLASSTHSLHSHTSDTHFSHSTHFFIPNTYSTHFLHSLA